jgi:hypothetical protein
MSMIIDGTNGLTFNNATTQTSAGCVLQVVNATYSTSTSNSSTTYADTGLTASITPKFSTSKILVLVSQNGLYKSSVNSQNALNVKLLRNSTSISIFGVAMGFTATALDNIVSASTCYLDSPATTSATTYKTQFANYSNSANVFVQANSDTSTITLLEIAG